MIRSRSVMRTRLVRSAKLSMLILGLLFCGIALGVWISEDPNDLPVEYDGFD